MKRREESVGIQSVTSLASFIYNNNNTNTNTVSDHEFENMESFPEENLLPPTLEYLDLEDCSKLRIMNNKGFLHLKSLKYLYIEDCPGLESLPEKEALPNSLYTLYIEDCPIIKEKYEKEGGERWHTISHIPRVMGPTFGQTFLVRKAKKDSAFGMV